MKLLAPLVTLLIIVSLMGCTPRPFSPPEGGYSIQMPGTPKQTTRTMNTAVGPVITNQYSYDTGGSTYSVAYADYPSLDKDVNVTLNNGRDGVLRATQGVLLLEEIIKVDGHPGREIKVEAPGGVTLRFRVVVVGTRMYHVSVATPKNDAGSPKIRGYLDSFRVTAPGKGG